MFLQLRGQYSRINMSVRLLLLFSGIFLPCIVGVQGIFAADVDLTLTPSGPSYVTPGSNITYELRFKNERNEKMTDIVVWDPLPAHTSLVSGGKIVKYNGISGVELVLNSLAANAVHTFTLVVKVSSGTPIDTVIENKGIEIQEYTLAGGNYLNFYPPGAVGTTVEAKGETMAILKNSEGRAFDVKVDGFKFENYVNAPPRVFNDDLKADDLFLMFGKGACQAGDTATNCVLSGPAKKWKEANINEMKGGHCDGMAATSLRFFNQLSFKGKSTPGDYQTGAKTVSDLDFPSEHLENYIAYYFQTQIFYPTLDSEFKGTPKQIVNKLISDLKKSKPVAYTLGVEQMPGHKEGHAIAAYGVEKVNEGEYRILVYDNNFPKQRKYIKVDMSANTWRYVTAATPGEKPTIYTGTATGDTSGGLTILPVNARDLSTGNYFECSFCNKSDGQNNIQANFRGSARGVEEESEITFQYAGEGAMLVIDDMGRETGYSFETHQDVNEIPGARVRHSRGGLGLKIPPRITVPGVYDEQARYTVIISGHTIEEESHGSLTITGEGFAIGVNHIELVPDEFFEFVVSPHGDHISFTENETSEAPSIFISYDPVHEGEPSVIFDVEGVTLHAGETVYLDLDPELERVHFQDTGAEEEHFDISMTLIWPDGHEEEFLEKINIPTGTDSASIDFGAWDGLQHPPIYIGDELQNPLVNHRLKLESATSEYDPTPQPNAPAGVYSVEATFSNVTEISLEDVYFTVANLGDGDVLLNGDDGPVGVGGVISVPAEDLGEDGILHSFDSFTFRFEVGLANTHLSDLVLDANGTPHDWIHPDPPPSYDANNKSFTFSIRTGELVATCGEFNIIQIPDGNIIAPGFTGNLIVGTNRADELIGSKGDDLIIGLKGHDYIDGRKGNDILCGNEGKDTIFGGKGNDYIEGGNGKDDLLGNQGNDIIYGGPRADYLDGGVGSDTLLGGRGADDIWGGPGQDNISGQAGQDYIIGGKGNDYIKGGRGADILFGGSGADYLHGNYGPDTLIGGRGADKIYGGAGRDELKGGKGNDYLHGGKAKDLCRGGKGFDKIVHCEK